MKQIAIYARSNEGTGSIQGYQRRHRQIEACLALAISKGYAEESIKIYQDDGVSGYAVLQNGEGMNTLIDSANNIELVIVSDFTRISRDPKECKAIIQKLTQAGITVINTQLGEQPELVLKHFFEMAKHLMKMEERIITTKKIQEKG